MNTYLNDLVGYNRAAGAEKENSIPILMEATNYTGEDSSPR